MLPPSMSRDDVLAELLDPPRRAYVPLPDTRAIERPGWRQLITPSVPQGLNQISLAQLDDDDNLDATIDAAISEYGGRPFVWRVGPDSRPADLGERLLRRGLRHDVSYGMARSTNLAASEGVVSFSAAELDLAQLVLGRELNAGMIDRGATPTSERRRR